MITIFVSIQTAILHGHQLVGDYFPNQVTSSKILSTVVTKMCVTWRVVHYFNTLTELISGSCLVVSKSQRRSMALVSNDRRERQGKYGHLWFEWVTYDIITSTFVLQWKKIRETVNLFLSKLTNEILLCFSTKL